MQHEQFDLVMDDGARLRARAWRPAAPRATLLLLHGIAEHSARYDALARRLAASGHAVYAFDQRGHGDTAGVDGLGYFARNGGWARMQQDVAAVHAHVRRHHPDLPHLLLGHSMGSLVAQHYAIEHGDELAGLILSATDFRPDPMPRLGAWLATGLAATFGPNHRSRLLDYLSLGAPRRRFMREAGPYAWLSRDPTVAEAYAADPYCGFLPSVSLWRDVYRGVATIARRGEQRRLPSTLPILLLVGGEDVLSRGGKHVRALAERYRRLGLRDVTLKIYPGARHEVFNETNRDEVIADLIAWLEAKLGTPEGAKIVSAG